MLTHCYANCNDIFADLQMLSDNVRKKLKTSGTFPDIFDHFCQIILGAGAAEGPAAVKAVGSF